MRGFARGALGVLLALGCACNEAPTISGHDATVGGGGVAASAGGAGGAGEATNIGQGGGGAGSTPAMKLISRGVPAFASSGVAESANDSQPNIAWSSESLPAWLAYDVSSVAALDRQQVLLAWYCYFADYLVAEPNAEQMLPLDYAVEINSAAGGGEPPETGWTEVIRVASNRRSARQHVFELTGANWLRLSLTKSSDGAKVMLDLDLYSAPTGGSDGWLFMGDSITYMATQRAFSDLPDLVERATPGRVPLVVDGALGGTNTTTAQEIIAASMAEFEGRYVVLAYGTNDHVSEYQMERLVQEV
ncbi:MAG TPA: SGNH/GDSL hydrolase family protein, partial [Polyangiaceae bacterium]|nr:SGNH/GDSL hydrolase family protein [Polyangiaceae bacterium]